MARQWPWGTRNSRKELFSKSLCLGAIRFSDCAGQSQMKNTERGSWEDGVGRRARPVTGELEEEAAQWNATWGFFMFLGCFVICPSNNQRSFCCWEYSHSRFPYSFGQICMSDAILGVCIYVTYACIYVLFVWDQTLHVCVCTFVLEVELKASPQLCWTNILSLSYSPHNPIKM